MGLLNILIIGNSLQIPKKISMPPPLNICQLFHSGANINQEKQSDKIFLSVGMAYCAWHNS